MADDWCPFYPTYSICKLCCNPFPLSKPVGNESINVQRPFPLLPLSYSIVADFNINAINYVTFYVLIPYCLWVFDSKILLQQYKLPLHIVVL